MFNVLIVDDKKSIRDGLKKSVSWHKLGFTVIGDVSSAVEAVKFIESECVDVLLTDIVMPDINGLQLIEEIRLVNPNMKVIILSAPEKVEYAQKAIQLGAFCYLTKPVNLKKLKTEFTNLNLILSNEKIEKYQEKEVKAFSTEQFLNNLVNNYYSTTETILKRAKEINFPPISGSYCFLRIILEKPSYPLKQLYEGSFQLLKSMAILQINQYLDTLGKAYIFNSNFAEISVLFFPDNLANTGSIIEQLKEDLASNLNIDLFIGVGKTYDKISHSSDSFTEAGKALEYRIIKKNSSALFYQDLAEFFKGKSLITTEIEETILGHLSLYNESALTDYILNIISNALEVDQSNISILYNICIKIIISVDKFLTTNIDDKRSLEQKDYYSIKSLLQKQDCNEIKDFIMDYLKECTLLIKNNAKNSNGLIIENVKKYLNEHYYENITLSKLSEVVYINPMYLSRLFKEKMGENFIDYLTKVRIEHAKRLLKDLSLKIYDITEMVGYKSRNHFGKTFKEITGLSPKEYRNKQSLLQ